MMENKMGFEGTPETYAVRTLHIICVVVVHCSSLFDGTVFLSTMNRKRDCYHVTTLPEVFTNRVLIRDRVSRERKSLTRNKQLKYFNDHAWKVYTYSPLHLSCIHDSI